ncbi:MAG: ABC transporter permease [Chloroflexota bacterium]|nr:ABC transporter permease [Chloroflexota bacterium]
MTTATLPRTRRLPLLREFGASVSTILVKELRSRFRGRRAFVIITVYLAVLALIAYGVYSVIAPGARTQAQFGGGGPFGTTFANASAVIGQGIFAILSVFQLLLVGFIAPAFTAGTISLEREKQTLDLLVTTPMRPGGIVVGKLLAALAFVGLMIIAALPISALVLMYGGASIEDLLRQQLVLLVTAMGLGAIGLFWSALVKRTQAATVLTYATVLALTVGTVLIFIFWSVASSRDSNNQFGTPRLAPEQLMWINPAIAMIDVVAQTEAQYGPFSSIVTGLRGNIGSTTICDGDVCVQTDTRGGVEPAPMPVPGVDAVEEQPFKGGVAIDCPPNARCAFPGQPAIFDPQPVTGHFWPPFLFTFIGMSLLLTLASMRLVVPTGLRFAFRRRAVAAPLPVTYVDPEAES